MRKFVLATLAALVIGTAAFAHLRKRGAGGKDIQPAWLGIHTRRGGATTILLAPLWIGLWPALASPAYWVSLIHDGD